MVTVPVPAADFDTILEFKKNNDVLLKLGFGLTLYSLDLSQPEQKQAVLHIFDEYVALYGDKLRWTNNPKSNRWKKLKNGPSSYITPHDWVLNEPLEDGFEFEYHGAVSNDDASDIVFSGFGMAEHGVRGRSLGILACHFPIKDVFDGKVVLPELFYRWCSILKPYHAHGGFGFVHSFDFRRGVCTAIETPLLFQFPGLQSFSLIGTGYHKEKQAGLYNGPACADWLIALSDPFVEKLGGAEAIQKAMHPLPAQPYEGGMALQAGDSPGLGKGAGDTLPDYMHLARVIEPVRAKKLLARICIPPGSALLEEFGLPPGDPYYEITCPQELTDRWAARFSG